MFKGVDVSSQRLQISQNTQALKYDMVLSHLVFLREIVPGLAGFQASDVKVFACLADLTCLKVIYEKTGEGRTLEQPSERKPSTWVHDFQHASGEMDYVFEYLNPSFHYS